MNMVSLLVSLLKGLPYYFFWLLLLVDKCIRMKQKDLPLFGELNWWILLLTYAKQKRAYLICYCAFNNGVKGEEGTCAVVPCSDVNSLSVERGVKEEWAGSSLVLQYRCFICLCSLCVTCNTEYLCTGRIRLKRAKGMLHFCLTAIFQCGLFFCLHYIQRVQINSSDFNILIYITVVVFLPLGVILLSTFYMFFWWKYPVPNAIVLFLILYIWTYCLCYCCSHLSTENSMVGKGWLC